MGIKARLQCCKPELQQKRQAPTMNSSRQQPQQWQQHKGRNQHLAGRGHEGPELAYS